MRSSLYDLSLQCQNFLFKELASGCYFGVICTSVIFGESEFQWNLLITFYLTVGQFFVRAALRFWQIFLTIFALLPTWAHLPPQTWRRRPTPARRRPRDRCRASGAKTSSRTRSTGPRLSRSTEASLSHQPMTEDKWGWLRTTSALPKAKWRYDISFKEKSPNEKRHN